MTNTRQYSATLALAAAEVLAASGANVTQPVTVLPLAKQLAAKTGCHISTAKTHIARAIRRARHDATEPAAWGGHRPGAGRPKVGTARRADATGKEEHDECGFDRTRTASG